MQIHHGNKRTPARFNFSLPPALKRVLWALALVSTITTGSTAEPQSSATQPVEPTDLGLKELMEMPIPVVEAASKYEQKITEAPASVTIITADDVKKYGYRSLADILQSAPGLNVTYDRNYAYLGVRGFSVGDFYTRNSRVLVLVDGHRMNNSLTDGAAIGTDFILDIDLIDRVEVITGPGSSLYGNNAFLGVINVITRKGRNMAGNGVEASAEAGSFDSYKGRVTYGHQFTNGVELLLSGTIYHSEGQDQLFYQEYNTAANNHGIAEKADGEDFKSGFGSIAFHDFSLEGGYITREKNNPTAQFLTDFNDSRLRTTDNRGYGTLKYAHEFPEVVDVTAQVYYDRQDISIVQPYVKQSGFLRKDEQAADWWGTELQLTKRLWERLTLTLGGEYRDDFSQTERFSDAKTGEDFGSYETNRQSCGVYLEGDFMIVTNLHLNAGGRYDQYGSFDPAFNPRTALIYNPFGQSVFKAIYGTAFRAPNFFEMYDYGTPASLKPETITTYELVYEQGLLGNHLRSSVAGFYNQIDDLIAFTDQ
jgi:outer membrane receptor for ferrienterochelin and colicins